MRSIENPVEADEEHVDVQQRVRQTLDSLFPSVNAAARSADMNPGQLQRILTSNKPGSDTLQRLADAWGVPAFIFFMPIDLAQPYIDAIQALKNNIT